MPEEKSISSDVLSAVKLLMNENMSCESIDEMKESDSDSASVSTEGDGSVSITLTDNFLANVCWIKSVDLLHEMTESQHNFLGFRTSVSNVLWRFYKKEMEEKIQLKELHEKAMKQAETLVKTTLANETIIENAKRNEDDINEMLRDAEIHVNPLGTTLRRNHRFFLNIHFQIRLKL